jgi:hypothetical protein
MIRHWLSAASMVFSAVLSLSAPATASSILVGNAGVSVVSTLISTSQTVVYLSDPMGNGNLEFRGWTSFTAAGTVGGTPVNLSVNADPGRGVGFVPGLNAQTLFPIPPGWVFGETYVAGEPIMSSVKGDFVTAWFRNENYVSDAGHVAPFGRFLRLTFFRPEGWLAGLDGAPLNPVTAGNASLQGTNNIPLPASGVLLIAALASGPVLRRIRENRTRAT